MNNHNDNKPGKSEYFELREKRLKLVYKILYAVVAVWIAVFISIGTENIVLQIAPVYAFILAASSMLIINIIKYALMEFQCMNVIGNIDESVLKQTEERYDYIWKSFSVILSINAMFMVLHLSYPAFFNMVAMVIVLSLCVVYFMVMSFVTLFKRKFTDTTLKILDIVGLIPGAMAAYSICAFICMVVAK